MENQHRKITGYRELDQMDIDLINRLKEIGDNFGGAVEALENTVSADKRWVEIGKTHLQQGIMALIRSRVL